jgi:hypothetical protein
MSKNYLPGYILFALLILFFGSFALHENILGKTLTTALVLVEKGDDTPVITLKEVEQAQSEFEVLVDLIRKNPEKIKPLPADRIDGETLWLARGIYSETKRPEEMELVAWVLRNRVETQYRGRDTYQDVVLDPYQFSAFNPDGRKRWFYSSLDTDTQIRSWQKALTIAHSVRLAEGRHRPFSLTTRHFYSERSMVGKSHPDWALGKRPITPERDFTLDQRRFRFFDDVL